jgi:predicted hydrocarbon binding protein
MSDPMLPNASLRVLFLSMEEVMGQHGVNAVLNASGLTRFVNNYPPNNLDSCVPFEDYATVVKAVEDFYGQRAARAQLIRVGRMTFQYALKEHPATLGLAGLALKVMPLNMQMKTVLGNVAGGMTKDLHEPSRVEEQADYFVYTKDACGACQGRQAEKPVCFTTVGAILESLKWATGKNFDVTETVCRAMGGPTCSFRIAKTPLG